MLLVVHLARTSQVTKARSQVTHERSLATSCCLALSLTAVLAREAMGWGKELELGWAGQATEGL